MNLFLPMPLAVAWVFRLTFSPPSLSLSSDFQLCSYPAGKKTQVLFLPGQEKLKFFVSVRYRKRCGGDMGPWQCMPSCF